MGFISIDCGSSEHHHEDALTKIHYTYDAEYIDTGISATINNLYNISSLSRQFWSTRSFPKGKRNCYNLYPVVDNHRYLIRASFMYGNYDGLNELPEFELYLGVNHWETVKVTNASEEIWTEIISLATADSIAVCLVNTGFSTPFISVLELRSVDHEMYTSVTKSTSLTTFGRWDMGASGGATQIRYDQDPYDRIWKSMNLQSQGFLITSFVIQCVASNGFNPPSIVMQTASQPSHSSNNLEFYWPIDNCESKSSFHFAFHFAELKVLNETETRELNIFINDGQRWNPRPIIPPFLRALTVSTKEAWTLSDGLRVSINKTDMSTLPPILNAFEIYRLKDLSLFTTDNQDVAALLDIKDKLGLKNKSWVGDPCLPQEYQWDSLTCNQEQNPRVISLDLSASRLEGEIPASIADLSVLESLNFSNNKLTGTIPESLADLTELKSLDLSQNNLSGQVPMALIEKNTSGALVLRIHENSNLSITNSYQPPRQTKSKKTVAILVISVASAVSLLFALVVGLIVKKIKVSLQYLIPPFRSKREEKLCNKERDDTPKPDATRAFTHAEIVKITNDFEKVIGKGGYGPVFYGCLENGHEVAVKLLSQESQQGYKEFLAEVKLLIRIHHKYLVSFIGFCDEGPEKILVYEYMSKGNLKEILSDKNRNSVSLNWEQRLRIALSVAQGLEYLHCGCKPPIIHRDVKTVNILLNENLEAKVADFGLSRLGPTEDDTHIWTIAAGTPGYVDPEYNITNKLTEKSDVYSFGIVLLELISGQPAIILDEERLHIVHWVTPKIKTGDIVSVVDPRLQGEYDINSMWKAVEIALACTPETAVRRPTISDVIGELRGCVELESSCRRRTSRTEYHTSSPITASINMEKEPGFDPSPR
ncbi:hypothetical protein AMTR_s00056p00190910 [Amborella trichopoda]|uniref:non-specific serine/threonine protein kinase n=1 Tax=Amborella trichopoda TaxID=13333 RepID=U5D1E9_AMBTC|nr:hypothetical protein AMTR_s00056p00190910 [Amborella trichopoda]